MDEEGRGEGERAERRTKEGVVWSPTKRKDVGGGGRGGGEQGGGDGAIVKTNRRGGRRRGELMFFLHK